MTKVEELRLDIIQDLARLKFMEGKHKEMTWGELEHHYGYPLVDPLISAARSEGVVEGAEQESKRWLGAIELAVKEGTLGGFVSDALDNASVLAPTKESEK